ncbi:uncharacterized protein LOC121404070 [Drosophila obscura]|uniref:uncharacterized protein LOC121404070 n=1 Tax=Drosophila obscura TaxID=7282 RepID=UPI001BB12176|nr:uncharacterized protein LOC121404070 [Drosophila obscura]
MWINPCKDKMVKLASQEKPRLANQLKLRTTKSLTAVSGIGDASFPTEGISVDLVLKSRISEFTTSISAVLAQKITDHQPSITVSTANWPIPLNIQFADPSFHKPQRIDLLIGAGLFFELLCVGQIQLAPELPLLQKTQLGWVLSGGGHSTFNNSSFIATQSSDDTNHSTRLDELVRQFWEVEHIFEPIARATKEELHCEDHFVNHHTRLPSGEYSVSLPIKRSLESLGDSYLQAKRQLENLERKFVRSPTLYMKYSAFMKEYLSLDPMSLVPNEDRYKCRYFFPHHCVIKEDSSTTKLRVVFDGSAVTTAGLSLNDLLISGPTIQAKLFHTLSFDFVHFPLLLQAISVKCIVPEAERESFLKLDDGSDVTKALGLILEPHKDKFLFTFAPQIGVGKHTKRSVLSTMILWD